MYWWCLALLLSGTLFNLQVSLFLSHDAHSHHPSIELGRWKANILRKKVCWWGLWEVWLMGLMDYPRPGYRPLDRISRCIVYPGLGLNAG